MHRILLELRDSQASALFGFLLTFLWILYARNDSFKNVKSMIYSCVLLVLGTVVLGWAIYIFAYFGKIVVTDPALSIRWGLALEFFKGGRGIYPVRSYGVAMASAFAVNITLLYYRAEKEGISPNTVVNASLLIVIGTLVGGRALFVLTQWKDYAKEPLSILKFWEGGLVFYGGYLGSFFISMFYMWVVKRQRFLPLSDLLSPYVGLGLAIHRFFGCFMNGCCYGRPTDMPWGVMFPIDHPGTKYYGASAHLHPTQVYETLNGLSIFFGLLLFRRYRKYQGQSTGLLLIIYAVNRYIIETFRGDLLRGTVGEFSTSQFISLGTFTAGLALLAFGFITKRPVYKSAPAEAAEPAPQPAA